MMVKTADAIKEKTISFFREKLSARNAKKKSPKAIPIVEEETSKELSPTVVWKCSATIGNNG